MNGRLRRALRVALLALASIAIFASSLAFTRYWDFVLPSIGTAPYQAVFLENGQTYFGHYYERLGPYVKVEDAFYIQQTAARDDQTTAESRVVRRGSELHQPYPYVLIPRDAVLFVEDLAPDSSIARYMDQELHR